MVKDGIVPFTMCFGRSWHLVEWWSGDTTGSRYPLVHPTVISPGTCFLNLHTFIGVFSLSERTGCLVEVLVCYSYGYYHITLTVETRDGSVDIPHFFPIVPLKPPHSNQPLNSPCVHPNRQNQSCHSPGPLVHNYHNNGRSHPQSKYGFHHVASFRELQNGPSHKSQEMPRTGFLSFARLG